MKEVLKANIKNLIPWRLRYNLKLLEAKGIKMPGAMKYHNDIDGYTNALYSMLKKLKLFDLKGKTVCEMGVGEYLTHAFLEYQMGAECEYLLEIEDYAHIGDTVKINKCYFIDESKVHKVRDLPRIDEKETWEAFLKKINGHYLTDGLKSYQLIPSDTVDFVFSDTVFEHIRKNVFYSTLKETYRFMQSGGVCLHKVDFRDHFGGAKNQLRFSDDDWEDDVHYRMDNYTNRLSCTEIVEMMSDIGFKNFDIRRMKFAKQPIRRCSLADQFKRMSDEDLLTIAATIIAYK